MQPLILSEDRSFLICLAVYFFVGLIVFACEPAYGILYFGISAFLSLITFFSFVAGIIIVDSFRKD